MKIRILLLVLLAVCTTSDMHSQDKCDIKMIDSSKRYMLNKFWNDLGLAVNKKDRNQMMKYFHFPFTCAPLIGDDTIAATVTKKSFKTKYYKLLLFDSVVKTLNNKKIDDVISYLEDDNKDCAINIDFLLVGASNKGGGLQMFMTLKEFRSEFKVVAIWTVP